MKEDHTPYTVEEVTWVKGLVIPDNQHLGDRIISWQYLRTKTKAENTDLGEKLVQRWTVASSKMKEKYSFAPKRGRIMCGKSRSFRWLRLYASSITRRREQDDNRV